jgi:hypothetical protein
LLPFLFCWKCPDLELVKKQCPQQFAFFDQTRKLEVERFKTLVHPFNCVFLFEYFAVTLNYGPSVGNRLFLRSVCRVYFIGIPYREAGHFEINRGLAKYCYLVKSPRLQITIRFNESELPLFLRSKKMQIQYYALSLHQTLIAEGEHEHLDFKFEISDTKKIARSLWHLQTQTGAVC